MYISKFQVKNYKSFRESEILALGTGFNLVIGPNNVGKTALLEALSLKSVQNPHRSLTTVPFREAALNPDCTIDLSFVVNPPEIQELFSRPGQYCIAYPRFTSEFATSLDCREMNRAATKRLFDWFRSLSEPLIFSVRLEKQVNGDYWLIPHVPSFDKYEVQESGGGQALFAICNKRPNGTEDYAEGSQPVTSEIGRNFAQLLASRIYKLGAERFASGACLTGNNPVLNSDASNLPAVLSILQGLPNFRALSDLTRRLFPSIRRISVQPDQQDAGKVTVLAWTVDVEQGRADLARPLSDSGTGLGQVLVILYLVLTSDSPRVIIIDEPQSFLHPGAVRKLIEILKTYSDKHQFIIATHSPAVISAAVPNTIFNVRLVNGESRIKVMDAKETSHFRELLADIGASLADVFGAERVLWVEGATEEVCFPRILEKLGKKESSRLGMVIKGVVTTGDLESKVRAKLVWEVYQKLSNSTALIPPAIGFIFDDEGRDEQEKKELCQMSGGLVTFTRRRMYENYLLDPKAIADVLNSTLAGSSETVMTDQVEEWLSTNNRRFLTGDSADPWQEHVDAYKLLKALFSHLTNARVSYLKTRHSVALTDWLLNNRPEALQGLASEIEAVLDRSLVEHASAS